MWDLSVICWSKVAPRLCAELAGLISQLPTWTDSISTFPACQEGVIMTSCVLSSSSFNLFSHIHLLISTTQASNLDLAAVAERGLKIKLNINVGVISIHVYGETMVKSNIMQRTSVDGEFKMLCERTLWHTIHKEATFWEKKKGCYPRAWDPRILHTMWVLLGIHEGVDVGFLIPLPS